MRIDKFISQQTGWSRSQATKVLKSGRVIVNDKVIKSGAQKVLAEDCILLDDEQLLWLEAGQYIMLHKPAGYLCSHDASEYPIVYSLFEHPQASTLHSVGRLDVDTTGLLLLTDDGQWSHRITSPKHQCEKTYLVGLSDPVEDFYVEQLEKGIMLRGEKTATLPAKLEIVDDYQVNLTISEGRYHQVKRMFAALGNRVEWLHRWKIGNIVLDESLEEGEYRSLSQAEIDGFR